MLELDERKAKFTYELFINNKLAERKVTHDYEAWYDKITNGVYELVNFKQILIRITKNTR